MNPNIKQVLLSLELDGTSQHIIELPNEIPYQKTKPESHIADDGTLVVRVVKDE